MEDKVNTTVVGAFVLALGAALVAGVLWLAAGLNGQKSTLPYQAIVQESVAGLNVGAPVKYLGVDVGKVSKIGIDPGNPRQVRMQFQLDRGTPVTQETEAVLKSQGLTGIAYVELSGGAADAAPLLAGTDGSPPTIRTKPSLSARLENVLTTVLAGLDRMSGSLSNVFDADNRAALKMVLADTAALTHALAAQKGAISNGIADASRTARNLAQVSAQASPALERVAGSADAVRAMANQAGLASASAGQAASAAVVGVQQISAEILPEATRLLGELNRASIALRQLGEQTQAHPNSLLLGGPTLPLGPGESATR